MNEELVLADLVSDYLNLLGSDVPAPGGGSASAFAAAQGCALARMVCELTKGKKKYEDSRELVENASDELGSLCASLLSLMDEDTQAFNGVSEVFSMPKTTEEEIFLRKTALEMALRECTKTPFRVMLLADQALQTVSTLVGRTNESAASDLGCAALSLKAAIQGAWLNVKINTASLRDRSFAAQYEKDGEAILSRALPLADRINGAILGTL